MEINFPQIVWNLIFHKFYWIQFSTEFYGFQFSTNPMEFNFPPISQNHLSTKFYGKQLSTFMIFNSLHFILNSIFHKLYGKQLSTVEVQNLVDHPVRSSNSRTSAAVLYKPFQLRAIWQRSVDPIATNCLLIFSTTAQCLKITQNVAFEFLNFGIFHHFLSY